MQDEVRIPQHKGHLADIALLMSRLKGNPNCTVIVLWGHFNFVQHVLLNAVKHKVQGKTWVVSEVGGMLKMAEMIKKCIT